MLMRFLLIYLCVFLGSSRQVGKYFHCVQFCSSFLRLRFARGTRRRRPFGFYYYFYLSFSCCASKHKQFVLCVFTRISICLSVSRPETVACRLMQIKQFKEINKKVAYKFAVKSAMSWQGKSPKRDANTRVHLVSCLATHNSLLIRRVVSAK